MIWLFACELESERYMIRVQVSSAQQLNVLKILVLFEPKNQMYG